MVEVSVHSRAAAEEDSGVEALAAEEEEIGVERHRQRQRRPV
jgi:hypothetical protein